MTARRLNKTEQRMVRRAEHVAAERGAQRFLGWARGFTAPGRRGDVPRRPALERELAAIYRRAAAAERS